MAIPAAVLARAQDTARAVGVRAGIGVDAQELLGGRAVLLGLGRAGRISAGGATRMLAARDGWCALTLSRSEDVDAVPALIESDGIGDDPWPAIETWAGGVGAAALAARARLLGLPVGVLGETAPGESVVRRTGPGAASGALAGLLIADLSAMWAGPLCGALLARAGATVVKVESAARPDGTRSGSAGFFDWMNGEKLSYEADFAYPEGLRRLLAVADVVIESSRPAALPRRGLGPEGGPARDGRIWLRITGHGATGEPAGWVAFGDDAAVSGGLVSGTAAAPEFCGDAIADPLTGLHAAAAVLDSHARGGGELIDVSMAAVAANYAALPRDREITCTVGPSVTRPGPVLGADNGAVDRMVAERLAATC